ncbi:Rne/Rng family ribonuclease, partial [Teichococcus cervicalis]
AAAAEATVPHEGVVIGEPADGPAPEPREAEEAPETPPETLGGRGKDDADENGREERRIPSRFMRHYKIQEVIRRRQIMLVQVVKEERGNKGAALTTYISLAGRFSVLMPNSPKGGGISRKITSVADRKRLREAIDELNMPRGMSMIVRTAGAGLPKPEIRRDCEYLLRLWDDIRERTLQSTAPALIYEEADLIKRSIRDVFGRDIEEIQVEGEGAYRQARDFMRMLMPQNERKIRLYRDPTLPLFARHGVDAQLDAMMSPTVQLKSGGYIVINQTEALVAIDVNSGRATRDRHIEDTALRTNMEAAEEIARQLRLRDMAGLIVIDFIDMESSRNDAQVERRLKEALKHDRARIQVGRISHFGLLEMSRQRLRPSLTEHSFITCPHCQGLGIVRSPESAALQVLRQIEEEGAKRRAAEIQVSIAPDLALHILNRRRDRLTEIEARYGMAVLFEADAKLSGPQIRIERLRAQTAPEPQSAPAALRMDFAPEAEPERAEAPRAEAVAETAEA